MGRNSNASSPANPTRGTVPPVPPQDHVVARHRRMLLPDYNGYRVETRPDELAPVDPVAAEDLDMGEFWRMTGI